MSLPQEWWDLDLTHKYGGNGFALVADYPEEWAVITSAYDKSVSRTHLVWSKCLKPTLRQVQLDGPELPVPIVPSPKLIKRRQELA